MRPFGRPLIDFFKPHQNPVRRQTAQNAEAAFKASTGRTSHIGSLS